MKDSADKIMEWTVELTKARLENGNIPAHDPIEFTVRFIKEIHATLSEIADEIS